MSLKMISKMMSNLMRIKKIKSTSQNNLTPNIQKIVMIIKIKLQIQTTNKDELLLGIELDQEKDYKAPKALS